jgi:CrcB protein
MGTGLVRATFPPGVPVSTGFRRFAGRNRTRYDQELLVKCLAVMCGGAVGSLIRYLVTLAVNEKYDGRFPLATFAINVTGSFLIGLLLVLSDREDLVHPVFRPLLVTGMLGGFTTFSTFEWELFALGQSGSSLAYVYGASSVVVGWLACWLGAMVARRVAMG